MIHLEKKYLVESFDNIRKKLLEIGVKKIRDVTSIHYYGMHDGNDVEKFVAYPDRIEIHILKESDGKFVLTEHRAIADKDQGFLWLKDRGYTMANIVSMDYEEYAYQGGIVGLYVIDGFLYSVILDFDSDQLTIKEKEFGLQNAEIISIPYNKYLEVLGKLRSTEL